MWRYVASLAFAFSAVALGATAATSRVNGNLAIEAGQQAGDVSSVNGSITLGRGARAHGVATVNGSVRLEEHSSATKAQTVNGSIVLGEQARVRDGVSTVNGALILRRGATVGGRLENVNGKLSLEGATASGGIDAVNGDIYVGTGSRVEGGIHVGKPHGESWSSEPKIPRITIEARATVSGPVRFEREVDLYLGHGVTLSPIEGVPPRGHSLP